MRIILLYLLSLFITSDDKWWVTFEADLGNQAVFFLDLQNKSFKDKEELLNDGEATIKSLYCRSNDLFQKNQSNIYNCQRDAYEVVLKPIWDIFYSEQGSNELHGLKVNYLSSPDLALLYAASMTNYLEVCIPENRTPSANLTIPLDDYCDYSNLVKRIVSLIDNADKLTRVKFLEKRGILKSNNMPNEILDEKILDIKRSELDKFNDLLKKETVEVYCRSALGILKNQKDCEKDGLEMVEADMNRYLSKFEDLDKKSLHLTEEIFYAFGLQYYMLAIDKCLPWSKVLDENLMVKKTAQKNVQNSDKCMNDFNSSLRLVLTEAENILKKEAEYAAEINRKKEEEAQRKRIANQLEQEKILKNQASNYQNESASSFFARLFTAVVIEVAEAYIVEKVSKELNIKTGVYHSEDFEYCYYSTPTGRKAIKKPRGRVKTINYSNAGTNKPIYEYSKAPPGFSVTNSVYNVGSSSLKFSKQSSSSCKRRID